MFLMEVIYQQRKETGQHKQLHKKKTTYKPTCYIINYFRRDRPNNNKCGARAELRFENNRLRDEYWFINADDDYTDKLKAHLHEGPNWPDDSLSEAHFYDEVYFPDISLFNGIRLFCEKQKRVAKMKLAVPIEQLIVH